MYKKVFKLKDILKPKTKIDKYKVTSLGKPILDNDEVYYMLYTQDYKKNDFMPEISLGLLVMLESEFSHYESGNYYLQDHDKDMPTLYTKEIMQDQFPHIDEMIERGFFK